MKIASFDIFDTCLLRSCGTPDVVFDILAKRLFSNKNQQSRFIQWRRHVEQHNNTIYDIYSTENLTDFKHVFDSNKLIELELKTESDLLRKNLKVFRLIEEKRNEGYSIKFISDMYLPSSFLKTVLSREGLFKDGDDICISAEYKARKDNGLLYKLIKEKFDIDEWIHYGDNYQSDVKMANKQGIKAKHIKFDFSPIEKDWISVSNYFSDSDILKSFAGVSRIARNHYGNTPEVIIAANYVAPIYLPFLLSTLNDAKKRGIDRLHFISRDGYIWYKMTECLRSNGVQFNFDTYYTFMSRKSLRRAFGHVCTKEDFEYTFPNKSLIGNSVSTLIHEWFNLDIKQVSELKNIQIIKTNEDQKNFLSIIFDNPKITSLIKNATKEDYQTTLEYLITNHVITKEGLAACVDIGWIGTTRLMLNILARSIGYNDIFTYYFSVVPDVLPERYGEFSSYYNENTNITNYTYIFESYFSASKFNTTMGYKKMPNGMLDVIFGKTKSKYSASIAKTNVEVCNCIIDLLCTQTNLLTINPEILYYWGMSSIDALTNFKYKVDLSPLAKAEGVSHPSLIRRLKPFELIKIAKGKSITDFDIGSIAYSFGFRFAKILWESRIKLLKFINKIR